MILIHFMCDLCISMKFMRLAYRSYKCLGYAHRLSWKIVFCTTVSHGLRHKPSDGHDDVIKWKHFPHRWHFVWEIHRSPMNSPHKGQWRRALMFSLIWAGANGWVNNRDAGDLRRHRAHYDVIVMETLIISFLQVQTKHIVWQMFNIGVTGRQHLSVYDIYARPSVESFNLFYVAKAARCCPNC